MLYSKRPCSKQAGSSRRLLALREERGGAKERACKRIGRRGDVKREQINTVVNGS